MSWLPNAMIFMVPIVGAIALFTFLAVDSWATERRKEREAYYEHELRKRMVDAGKLDGEDIRALVQFENDKAMASGKQSMVVGGMVLAGVGVGLLFGLRFIDGTAVWMVGFIPLGIGAAILLYWILFAPDAPDRPQMARRGGPDES